MTYRKTSYDFPNVIEQGERLGASVVPNTDITPGQAVPLIRNWEPDKGEGRVLERYHWGYRPNPKAPFAFNARRESLEGRYWSKAFRTRRCLLPADGWYEWVGEPGEKQRYFFELSKSQPFLMAGIYGEGAIKNTRSKDWEKRPCVVVITTPAQPAIEKTGHPRQPVILDDQAANEWLENDSVDDLMHLLSSRIYPGLFIEAVDGPVGVL